MTRGPVPRFDLYEELEVSRQASVESRPRFRRHRPIDDDGLDPDLVKVLDGGLGLIQVRVAMTDVRESMARRESPQEIQRANALAGGQRIGKLFVENRDVHGWTPFQLITAARASFPCNKIRIQEPQSQREAAIRRLETGGCRP